MPRALDAFHPVDEATGAVKAKDLRIIARLRDKSGYFLDDFPLMVQRLTTTGCKNGWVCLVLQLGVRIRVVL